MSLWRPTCPEPNQYETVVVSCPDGSTPVNGMCGTVKATATTTCAPLPPPDASGFAAVPALIANIDHIKVASFANPITASECPPGNNGCQSVNFPNYGVIKAASTAPLATVVYGISRPVEPTNPTFPAEFFTANADCTVDGTSCRYIGADFSTNVMTEYDATLPYIVDTALSIPVNTGVFVKQGSQAPPTFTAPPGYTQYEGGALGSTPLGAVQSKATIIECANACNSTGATCTGFNYRQSTRECQLFQGDASPSYVERNAVGFVREPIPTVATFTTYPSNTNMVHEGTYCSNANICNADLTKLVNDGVVASFSTADLDSCAYCPIRSYDKVAGVVTNEVGTFAANASTYQQHLLYQTQQGESSPDLIDGYYSITPWLQDVGSVIFGTQQVLYSKNDLFHGLFTVSNGTIYGTVQSTYEHDGYDKTKAAILNVLPVTYVSNGYVFQLLDGGVLSWSTRDPVKTGSSANSGSKCPTGRTGYGIASANAGKCYAADSVPGVRGTPEFNRGVFVFRSLKRSNAAFFSGVIGSKTYVALGGKKWAIALGAPGMTTPIQTSTPVTIPSGGYGATTAYGNIQLTVTAVTGVRNGDRVVIECDVTRNIQFDVVSVSGTMVTVSFNTTLYPHLGGLVIPQGTNINSSVFKKDFIADMLFTWYQDVDGGAWTEVRCSNDVIKAALVSFCLDDGVMKDPYDDYGLFRSLSLPPAPGARYTTGGCDSGCSEYLLYNCYNGDNQSCDTANGGVLVGPVCSGTWKACRPDNNTLLTTFSYQISNLTPLTILRMDSPPGYSGQSHAPGVYEYNRTSVNVSRWSTIYIPQTYKDSSGTLRSNTIPKDQFTQSLFPSWTVERIVNESYKTITVSLAASSTGCPPGYGVSAINSTQYCKICPAGTWSAGGFVHDCAPCSLGHYCPQGSTNDTTQCTAGFYCETPALQITCPLGFYCPSGSTRPISCDTEILPDGTTQTTTITSSIPAATTQQTTVTITVPSGFTFVKAAVVGLPGIVGPLKYAGGTTFTLVTPQFWSTTISSGTTLTVQTKAHYCPLGSSAPQRCGRGLMCPTSMQQLYCPAGNYCNDGENLGVFAGTQCPAGSYYAPPNVANGNILAFGQSNTDGSKCYTCPAGTTGPTPNQDGCICSDSSKTFSVATGTCIKICPAGSAPDSTDPNTCTVCPNGYYTNQAGLAACIKCADNFTSVGTDTNGTQVTSGAVKCRCTTTRADGGTLANGTVSWDETFNRCKVTCSSGYTPFWSDCVPNSINATPINLVCPYNTELYNGACYSCPGGIYYGWDNTNGTCHVSGSIQVWSTCPVSKVSYSRGGANTGGMGSDIRLKKNITKTGRMIGLLPEYTWRWNEEAHRIGVSSNPTVGIIAQEALSVYPEVISIGTHGYYLVDYTRLKNIT